MAPARSRRAVKNKKRAVKAAARPKARVPARKPPAEKLAAKATKLARVPPRVIHERRLPETLRLRSIAPSFTVNDLDASVAFYTGALGFFVSERWTNAEGRVTGVMLKAGGCEIGLSQDDWAKGRERQKGVGMRLWCETIQDVDALAARVASLGFALTEEPTEEMGMRHFSVNDPDGFQITIFREIRKP